MNKGHMTRGYSTLQSSTTVAAGMNKGHTKLKAVTALWLAKLKGFAAFSAFMNKGHVKLKRLYKQLLLGFFCE